MTIAEMDEVIQAGVLSDAIIPDIRNKGLLVDLTFPDP